MIRISFLMVVFLSCVVSSYSAKVAHVDTICKDKGIKHSFCMTLLKPKDGADLVTLAEYTIDVARNNLTNTVNFIRKLISESGNDLKTKHHYEYCLSQFGGKDDGALTSLDNAEEMLKNRNYDMVLVQVGDIMANYDNCIVGESDPATYHKFPDKSLLPKYAKDVLNVAMIMNSIIIAIKAE